uniref:Predicted GPI-anchored protein 58 n=1 Tax=Nicotiana sylvestris TaxID=4096 RepID=A0A1U7WW55_NICSY|nr:PREDICTED: predicted GPI-anchored protein 58 [Nicotiana sylvestris]
MQGDDNPKNKNFKGPTTTPTGQSEEPVVIMTPAQPASTSTDIPPGPSASDPEIPSSRAYPVTAHRLSQALLSINNWMQTVSSKFSILTTTIEAQSTPPPPQDPVPSAHPQLEKSQRPSNRKRMIPRADDAVIQLADPPEASSNQPQDAPQEPVQA